MVCVSRGSLSDGPGMSDAFNFTVTPLGTTSASLGSAPLVLPDIIYIEQYERGGKRGGGRVRERERRIECRTSTQQRY